MRTFLLPAALLLFVSTKAQNPTTIQLVPWADGLPFVTDIAHAADDRLFVVQQTGLISIVTDSMTVLPAAFLDIQDSVLFDSMEQGLLGLAFDPDFANNGYFYVNYISGTGGTHSRISRFSVSGNPNVADATSEQILYTVAQPYSNHKGGDLDFGPDGYLYVPFGDGGSAGDPQDHAQNLSDPLGDIIRIDVSDPDTTYTVPPFNPFVGAGPDTLPEIWASGLRNPYRFGFDRLTGDLWLGDVGQSAWEEIDFQPASDMGGANYGWRCYEGLSPFNPLDCLPDSEYTAPVTVHLNDGNFGQWCAIIGGRVYRGAQWPHLSGRYIYTDFCKGEFWSLMPTGPDSWMNEVVLADTIGGGWSCIAEDMSGELFAGNVTEGMIYKLIDRCPMEAPLISYDGAMLATSGAPSYQWYLDNMQVAGAADQSYIPMANGNYYVEADFGNGCVLNSDTLLVLGLSTGALTVPIVSMMPNPANDDVTILWSNPSAVDEVRMLDMSGRTLLVRSTQMGERTVIDTRDLVVGNYLLQLRSSDGAVLITERLAVVH